jgi:hypothetical protein
MPTKVTMKATEASKTSESTRTEFPTVYSVKKKKSLDSLYDGGI